MARPLRVAFKGAIYHVNVRGHSRSPIFRDDYDRRKFISRLALDVLEFEVRLYSYSLIPNHYHLVMETPHANISQFMQSLQTSYHLYFNKRHGRCGQVSQGRFKAKLVEGDSYLLKLGRYVHLNPTQTKSCRGLSIERRLSVLNSHKWSSYRGYVDPCQREAFVDYAPMLGLVEAETGNSYRSYVESGLAVSDSELMAALKASPHAIGSEGFRLEVRARYEVLLRQFKSEDVSFRRVGDRADPAEVIRAVRAALHLDESQLLTSKRGTWSRAIAAKMLRRFAGCTQREAAELLRMGTGSAVCLQLQSLERSAQLDPVLREQLGMVEASCSKLIT